MTLEVVGLRFDFPAESAPRSELGIMVQLDPNAYLTLDDAATRLHVPSYYLLEILEQYGITTRMREKIGRSFMIRAGDLRGIRKVIKDDELQRGAA